MGSRTGRVLLFYSPRPLISPHVPPSPPGVPWRCLPVISRVDRREPISRDDADRHVHLDVLAQAMERFDAQLLDYGLMGLHYHMVLRTPKGNLSRLMRHLNRVYAQRSNRRHGLVGSLGPEVFQGHRGRPPQLPADLVSLRRAQRRGMRNWSTRQWASTSGQWA
ncbi:MAG: transposase [Rubrivivax sp.]|nr:transposase [Rubrivivax sp.]